MRQGECKTRKPGPEGLLLAMVEQAQKDGDRDFLADVLCYMGHGERVGDLN